METEIKYKNVYGIELTLQQVQVINDEYIREQYQDGELKREDVYENGIITSGSYYLSDGEDITNVLTEVQNIWDYGFFYLDVITIGDYTVRNWEAYNGLVIGSKGKTVYDNQQRSIATQSLDLETLSVRKTKKRFYLESFGQFYDDNNVSNFGTLFFDYNPSGITPRYIRVDVNLPGYEFKEYYIGGGENILLEPLIAEIFDWESETFYHSDTPLIPD